MTNVATSILAGKDPGRIALRFVDRDVTYGEIELAVREIARHLRTLGCAPGSRILLADRNSFFWIAAYFGIMTAGCVAVPVPQDASGERVRHIVDATQPVAACAGRRWATAHPTAIERLHLVTDGGMSPVPALTRSQASFGQILERGIEAPSSPVERGDDDLAAIMFTSGSTRQPRGVMVSHGNIAANTRAIVESLGLDESDRIMAVLPFHYCFGLSLVHTHLTVGGSVVVDFRFMYPEVVLQRMTDTDCTGFAGVPSHFRILLRQSGLRDRRFPHLRRVQQAGGRLHPFEVRALRSTFPDARICIMYGQTEATARLACLPHEWVDRKPGSVGRAIPGVELDIVDERGCTVLPGEAGEIVARGDNVALGYWDDPVESARVFRAGRLHTGDIGTLDTDGFLYILDRASDFLKVGGVRVSCREIEEILADCPEISDAAVVGTPDDLLGEAVAVFVVPSPGGGSRVEERVADFCRRRLSHDLLPRKIVVVGNLPRNSAGKLLKRELETMDSRVNG